VPVVVFRCGTGVRWMPWVRVNMAFVDVDRLRQWTP